MLYGKLVNPILKFLVSLVEGISPESTDCEADALVTTAKPRYFIRATYFEKIISFYERFATGFMRERVETEAPAHGEHYSKVFKDIENVIFDGAMHWQNGRNLAYFPTGCSYPAILGDILDDAVASVGFTWVR